MRLASGLRGGLNGSALCRIRGFRDIPRYAGGPECSIYSTKERHVV